MIGWRSVWIWKTLSETSSLERGSLLLSTAISSWVSPSDLIGFSSSSTIDQSSPVDVDDEAVESCSSTVAAFSSAAASFDLACWEMRKKIIPAVLLRCTPQRYFAEFVSYKDVEDRGVDLPTLLFTEEKLRSYYLYVCVYIYIYIMNNCKVHPATHGNSISHDYLTYPTSDSNFKGVVFIVVSTILTGASCCFCSCCCVSTTDMSLSSIRINHLDRVRYKVLGWVWSWLLDLIYMRRVSLKSTVNKP